MSISSNEYKPLRKSQSLPHIASRNDSSASGITVTTAIGSGSCSILDQIGYNTMCNNHHQYHHDHDHHHHHHHLHNHHHHCHQHSHPNHYKNHQQYENMSFNTRLVADLRQLMTLRQHYYPEGGWGWLVLSIGFIVQCISHGLHMSIGVLVTAIISQYHQNLLYAGMIGSLSIGIGLAFSPVIVALCRHKSTRLLAVIGGLVTTLGCLFSSFAQQFHQLFFSYGIIVGIGVGLSRDCSSIMVAQYFKKKRELVEIVTVAGSGLGIIFMSHFFVKSIDTFGWRYGLQCVTATVFLTFFLGLFYRSASLYHPQRRAILHLKNQRRKVKDKNKRNNRVPFFDFKTLRSKTVRIILLSSACSGFGIYIPIVHLAKNIQIDRLQNEMLDLQTNFGIAWILGTIVHGLLVIRNTAECHIARQYLCQVSLFMCAICMLALSKIQANYESYFIIVWVYGFFCGGYHYSLRVYTFERVRARNFAQAWSFVQFSQSLPIVFGVTIAEFLNDYAHKKSGYLFGFGTVLCGSILLFLVDVHKRNISRHKHTRSNGSRHFCVQDDCPKNRKLSFTQEPDIEPGNNFGVGSLLLHTDILVNQLSEEFEQASIVNASVGAVSEAPIEKPELTCISEEGIADMDLPDNIFEDYDFNGDCITSCNKVENYLVLSEFENNLNVNISPMDKVATANNTNEIVQNSNESNARNVLHRTNSTANKCTRI